MQEGYVFWSDEIVHKHEVTEGPQCDAYSVHIHNAYELIFFVSGDATHVIEDRKYKLRKGDLILIRPMQYHFIQIDGTARYERYNILFDPERHGVESVALIPEDVEVINIAEDSVACGFFERYDFYRQGYDDARFARLLSHLLAELFYRIKLLPYAFSTERDTLSPLISGALRYINANLSSVTGIHEVAEHLFVSESYLFRLFKTELHQTPKKYIREKRLYMAQRMLAMGERPTTVSERCGFSDYTTFYRNYTAFFGKAPTKTVKTP